MGDKPITPERLKAIPEFDRKTRFWQGIWCFIRDHGPSKVVSEHDDAYWEVEGFKSFCLFSRKGHWKRLGYGEA